MEVLYKNIQNIPHVSHQYMNIGYKIELFYVSS